MTGLLLAAALAALAPDDPAAARGFDNLRFGLTQFTAPAIADLFAERGAIVLGFDYALAEGLAVGVETQNLFERSGDDASWLSVTPVQLKLRGGWPAMGRQLVPFATAGAGPTMVALVDGRGPRTSLGLGATLGVGVMVQQAVAVEVTASLGQAGPLPYHGLQLRVGTAFGALAGVPHEGR